MIRIKEKTISETPLKVKSRMYDYDQIPEPPKGFTPAEGFWIAVTAILVIICVYQFVYYLTEK